MRRRKKVIIEYWYPILHKVSFTYIAERHILELCKYFNVIVGDESFLKNKDFYSRNIRIFHPYFYIAYNKLDILHKIIDNSIALIGFDVADSDRISNFAVQLANMATCIIVPSKFCRDVYIRSGVKVDVHVVPHGLSDEWFSRTIVPTNYTIHRLREEKTKHGYIYLLYILMHSPERKGYKEVIEVYREISRMYKNVKLISKVGFTTDEPYRKIMSISYYTFTQTLTENNMIALYDTCDIYLLFSVGGGFEHCGLQAIARGVPTVASNVGSWTEFIPECTLVPHDKPRLVFNEGDLPFLFHNGYGYPVNIEKAVDKIKDIIENLDEYKAKTREHFEKIKENYKWTNIGLKLKEIIEQYIK